MSTRNLIASANNYDFIKWHKKAEKWHKLMDFSKLELEFFKFLLSKLIFKCKKVDDFEESKLLLRCVKNELKILKNLDKEIKNHLELLSLNLTGNVNKMRQKMIDNHFSLTEDVKNFKQNLKVLKTKIYLIINYLVC